MGLRPGDVLLRTGDQNFERPEDALAVASDVTIWRSRRQMTLPVTPPFSLDVPTQGATLTSVQPGSRLHAAGLRPGDRILEPAPADLNRLLGRNAPLWVTFDRDDRRMGVLVP
jgi:hypothetical protein